MEKSCDILIIGAGASGLTCAVSAAQKGAKRILLLERLSRPGKKLLVTGNGRCNLSHENITPDSYHGTFDPTALLSEIPDIRPFFEQSGLFTVTDAAGRIYPLSNTAVSVSDALRFAAEKAGAGIITDASCGKIIPTKNGFTVKTAKDTFTAKAAVLAGGGCASPVQGSDGSCLSLAKSLGHEITPLRPALCPLPAENTKPLDGVRYKCTATLTQNGRTLRTEQGEVQFTKTALSGICIFNLSAVYQGGQAAVSLDLLPDFTPEQADLMLTTAVNSRKGVSTADALTGIFNYKLALYLLKRAGISPAPPASKLTNSQIVSLTQTAKALTFSVTPPADFTAAQVTAGGVKADEIDDTLMSRKINGLFFAGEILDVHGDCGGYNLHFAFASGIKAGRSCAEYLKREQQ